MFRFAVVALLACFLSSYAHGSAGLVTAGQPSSTTIWVVALSALLLIVGSARRRHGGPAVVTA